MKGGDVGLVRLLQSGTAVSHKGAAVQDLPGAAAYGGIHAVLSFVCGLRMV